MDILIVDGYNIIGAWPELRELRDVDLALARDRLVERMAEYQAFTGCKVIIVFDAHLVQGTTKNMLIIKWKSFSQKKMKQQMNISRNWRSRFKKFGRKYTWLHQIIQNNGRFLVKGRCANQHESYSLRSMRCNEIFQATSSIFNKKSDIKNSSDG